MTNEKGRIRGRFAMNSPFFLVLGHIVWYNNLVILFLYFI